MSELTVTQIRAEASRSGNKRFFTGRPCRRGHVCERYTSTGGCIECLHPKAANSSAAGPIMFNVPIPLDAERASIPKRLEIFREYIQRAVPDIWKAAHAEWERRSAGILESAGGTATLVMTEKAGDATYEQFKEIGWTDAQMVNSGYARFVQGDSLST